VNCGKLRKAFPVRDLIALSMAKVGYFDVEGLKEVCALIATATKNGNLPATVALTKCVNFLQSHIPEDNGRRTARELAKYFQVFTLRHSEKDKPWLLADLEKDLPGVWKVLNRMNVHSLIRHGLSQLRNSVEIAEKMGGRRQVCARVPVEEVHFPKVILLSVCLDCLLNPKPEWKNLILYQRGQSWTFSQ